MKRTEQSIDMSETGDSLDNQLIDVLKSGDCPRNQLIHHLKHQNEALIDALGNP